MSDRGSGGRTPRPPVNGGLRIGSLDGESSVTLAAGDLEATFLPGLGLLGTSLRHRGQELLALPGGVAGYRDRHVTGLPLLAPWANRLPEWRYQAAGVEVDLDGLDLATDPGGLPIHGTLTAHRGWQLERLAAGEGLGHAPGQPGLRRLPGAAGRVPLPPPADRDRHRRSGDTGGDHHRRGHRRAAGTGRLRLAPLPAAPRRPAVDLAAAAPRPGAPGPGRPGPAHRQDSRRAVRGRPGRRPHLRRPVRPRPGPGRPVARPGGGRPAPAGRLRRGLRPRPGVRPSRGPSSSASSR